ncbi:uncharacterized protein LOC122293510 [Carya illinoinensis]|uniref:uncharacterized protein LOC122293510 n=1 Tax=Carya illinoinensis TaxID=32201 RepID=UPI001C725DCC|nr:uncharacterized protein LOC122293510 [Carya illinoinensis]
MYNVYAICIAGPERADDYAALLKAVRKVDWNATREFLHEHHPHALTAIILFSGGTVLHAAVDAEQEHIVVELVNMISEHDLAMQDSDGHTALHAVSIIGNYRMAEFLITKNKNLVSIRNIENDLPVTLAMACEHKDLARYLYSQTPFVDLEPEQGHNGAKLLKRSIYARDLGFKRLYEMKLVQAQFQQLLSRMCEAIPTNTSSENVSDIIAPAIFSAINKGNFEFVYHIVMKTHPDLLVIKDVTNRRSIFLLAVLHRQHKIFSLVYNLKKNKFLLNVEDDSKNSILHTAGMLTEHTIDHIRGAALQK